MAKILVVDDMADNIKLLQLDLEDDGYEVVTASDGEQALVVAEEELPTVILLDIMMPKLDGIEACKRLKENPALRHIPVIMVSAADQVEDVIRGLDAGAMDYISKPINYPIVAARVRSAVRVRNYEDSIRNLNEDLERALRARSTFLATMSHEIRTPITAIMGLAEIVKSGEVLDELNQTQAAESIFNNSRYLLEIINNILDLSKSESASLTIEKIRCSLVSVLNDVNSIQKLKAEEKEIRLFIDFEYPIPETITSDPTRLKQIVLNLVSNAIKFTESGSVRVSAQYLSERDTMIFEVTDTGIGMTSEEVGRLFQPFQQANETITRRFGGTGLGLCISKDLAEKLGGTIEVESVKNVGTTFRVIIPDVKGEGQILEGAFVKPVVSTAERRMFEGRVLVVEDEPMNQKLIRHTLERVGVEVELAANGKEGIEKGGTGQFDLIFMDMHLPEMTGISVVEMLRSQGVTTKIVALTASQEQSDLEGFLHAGCEEFVPKPFQRHELYNCLGRFLGAVVKPSISDEEKEEDDKRYAELIIRYIKRLQKRLSEIERDMEIENWEGLREKAHNLAGAGIFGLPQVSLIAKLLEEKASRKNRLESLELVTKLKHEIRGITHSEFTEEATI